VQAQLLPMQPGDAVVSVSPGLFSSTVSNGGTNSTTATNYPNDTVLTIIRVCQAPASTIGNFWHMTPAEYSTYTYKHPDWVRNKLGNIFGIAIDDNKNIYVTSTGFYGQQYTGISTGSVFKINGNTGSVSLLKDLHGSAPTNPLSLGNIKFFNGNLYVSDLLSGNIFMLDAISGNILSTYNPGFTDGSKPCGLAISNLSGSPRLFFSRNNFWAIQSSVYSISIVGNTFGSDLMQEIAPGLINTNQPLTDMAFNKAFDRIIFCERTTSAWNTTSAHNSTIYEFKLVSGVWTNLNPNPTPPPFYYLGEVIHKNAAGGISYSPNILGSNCLTGCDSTIVATADLLIANNNGVVYGISEFRDGPGNGSNNGINIDVDNNVVLMDKTWLGDVEVCQDNNLKCDNCDCGVWGNKPISIDFNVIIHFPNETTKSKGIISPPLPKAQVFGCGDSYSFIQNRVSGILNVSYTCNGSCAKNISWQLINTQTNAQVSSGTTFPIDLAQFNNLTSGTYTFKFIPKCGTKECPPCEFIMVITSDPPSCCPSETEIRIEPGEVTYNSNDGSYYQGFILNSNVQMSEIRINVEHFELNSKDPDCIACINMPKTWGTLSGASYNGHGLTKPVNTWPFVSSQYANGRELVYKPGSFITINGANLNVILTLPKTSDIECCEITANICLKFTFKDKDCRECTYIYCNENIPLKKSKEGNPNGIKIENINKEVKKATL
jgi:hypothetical protein